MRLLATASRRALTRQRWLLALVVLGIAIGVAVVVAVDLANESARRAFALSLESASGRATHQIVGGPAGLDERLYARLRLAGVREAAPLVEAYATAGAETLRLLGVDPFAETGIRAHLGAVESEAIVRLLTEPGAALLAAPTAARLGLSPGDRLEAGIGGRRHALTLVGLLRADRPAALDGLLLVDIATAQEITGSLGRLSAIDLAVPEDEAGDAALRRIAGMLPPEAALVRAAARGQTLVQMTRAFRTNLTAMSLLALVVGSFLIYNTMTFAVLRRRALLGTMRALGVTRAEIFRLVLAEALAIGLAGAAIGLALGAALGLGLVRLVTRTIGDLYFVVTVRDAGLAVAPFAKGLALGLLATTAATLPAAFEAAGTAPRLALLRSTIEARVRRASPRLAATGLAMIGAALLALGFAGRGLVAGFAALFLLILGLTLLVPLAVAAMARLGEPLARHAGVVPRLAIRGVVAALSRTGVAIAALMLAVAAVIGVGVMIASFRASVETWLDSTLRADLYVSVPGAGGARAPGHLDPSLVAGVRALPGIGMVVAARYVTLEAEGTFTELLALDFPDSWSPAYRFKQAAPDAWAALAAGRAVLVTEPYAYRNAVGLGDRIRLRTREGERALPIAGVLHDYSSENGLVVLAHALYRRLYDDPHYSALRLYLSPGADPAAVADAVRGLAAGVQAVQVRSNRELRALSLAIFDRTFTITEVLRLLAVVVAFVGILSALMALELERAREYAVLRALGMTPGEVGRMAGTQTALMGLAAGVLAVPVGLALALMLIEVINRRAFGWSMQTLVPIDVLAGAIALAVLAAVAAGIYPASRLARARPVEGLREE